MRQFSIYEENMERLEKKLNRISNKCKKYGCVFHFERIGEEFKTLKDKNGASFTSKFIMVEVEGIANIPGWKFIASVDHTKEGNIIKGISEIEVPERYYRSEPTCEHCGIKRYRKKHIYCSKLRYRRVCSSRKILLMRLYIWNECRRCCAIH